MAQVNQITGIKVTADSGTACTFVKIENGVMDVDTLAAGTSSTFQLTSVTVDTTNHVVSGYTSDGVRYVFDKRGAGQGSLDIALAGSDT
tara:strand:+ start:1005 stop:1271 length:267 start_codon:yes stop_codon:yes gene_type:complete